MSTDLNDVQGAFLNGVFSHGEEIYLRIRQGFEKYYKEEKILKLNKTLYGLKQAAYVQEIGLNQLREDPCIFYRTEHGLNIWTSWVNDIMSCSHEADLVRGRQDIKQYFRIKVQGQLEEYVRYKVANDQSKVVV